MTLVVSVVSEAFVFQVSDRRATLIAPNGTRSVAHQPLTKSVVFCDRAIFGFTGYAVVDRVRSDLWIAHQLKDVSDLGDGFVNLRDGLTKIFRRPQYRLGHAIVAAGYKLEEDSSLSPYYALVSNQWGNGRWLDKPMDHFEWHDELAPQGTVGVFAAPNWLSPERLGQLRKEVATAQTLQGAIGEVVGAIREVAAAHDEVGPEVIVSVLPRASAGRARVMLTTGGPPGDTPTFHYLSPGQAGEQFGPTFVCSGNILSDPVVAPLTDDVRQQMERDRHEFRRARRPRRAYVVPVRTRFDPRTAALFGLRMRAAFRWTERTSSTTRPTNSRLL